MPRMLMKKFNLLPVEYAAMALGVQRVCMIMNCPKTYLFSPHYIHFSLPN